MLLTLLEQVEKVEVLDSPPADHMTPARDGEVIVGSMSLHLRKLATLFFAKADALYARDDYDIATDPDGTKEAELYALEAEYRLLKACVYESIRYHFSRYFVPGGTLSLREEWQIAWIPQTEDEESGACNSDGEGGTMIASPRRSLN